MGDRSTQQRLVGVGQVIGGIAGLVYGGGYGAGGGSGNLIGQGVANLQGKDTDEWYDRRGGFGQDVLSSFGLGSLHKNYDPNTTHNRYGNIGQGVGGMIGGYTGGLGGGKSPGGNAGIPGGGGVAVPQNYPGAAAGYQPGGQGVFSMGGLGGGKSPGGGGGGGMSMMPLGSKGPSGGAPQGILVVEEEDDRY